jgi:glucokinase
MLGQIQRTRESLSPAERRVADHVLAHPRSALGDPIAEIARAAQVSQPTVIRFCRTLGCEGLSDFKLRLASGLSATVPVTHTQVTGEDSMLELGVKVLGNTASAILAVRDQLNRDTLARAIELLAAAERIEFYAVGHYGVVADDAQFKFLRFGVPSASFTDPRLQVLAANVLKPDDVVVVISSSGRIDDLLAVADAGAQPRRGGGGHHRQPFAAGAQGRRGADRGPRGRRGHPRADGQPHPAPAGDRHPGRGRGHAQGWATWPPRCRASTTAGWTKGLPDPMPAGAKAAGPGISAAGTLARLTSHSR